MSTLNGLQAQQWQLQHPCCPILRTENLRCVSVKLINSGPCSEGCTGLGREEQLWLAQRINDHIKQLTGAKTPKLPEAEEFRPRRISAGSSGGASGLGGSEWGSSSDMGFPQFWDTADDSAADEDGDTRQHGSWWHHDSRDEHHSHHDSSSHSHHDSSSHHSHHDSGS